MRITQQRLNIFLAVVLLALSPVMIGGCVERCDKAERILQEAERILPFACAIVTSKNCAEADRIVSLAQTAVRALCDDDHTPLASVAPDASGTSDTQTTLRSLATDLDKLKKKIGQ